MDIDIVNTILRLCSERQTCLFEVADLCKYCLEKRLCTNEKYVLASIKNYTEIFKISRDRNRIEFHMPFEICRNPLTNGICQINGEFCSNLHVCYEFFSTNSCRRGMNCPYVHQINERFQEKILGTLVNLDLDALTKAFRIYCQSKRHVLSYNSSGISSTRSQPPPNQSSSSSIGNNPTTSSSSTNTWKLTATTQIIGNGSWKTTNRGNITSKILPTQQQTPVQTNSQTLDKGVHIYWKPQKDIQPHFIEVVFSNQNKSGGGPIRTHTIYQQLGIAQIFYQSSEIVDRVIHHDPVTFQLFTFFPRLFQRTIDLRHICFSNLAIDTTQLPFYIETVSIPYQQKHFDYYLQDQQTIIVEYSEDIDVSKISSNIRTHPDYRHLPIKCIQLYRPEILLIEYDHEYSEDEIRKFFKNQDIFHIKTYSSCAFIHFYSSIDLMNSIKNLFENSIKFTPIYLEITSQGHLDTYLKTRQLEFQSKPRTNGVISNEQIEESPQPEPVIEQPQEIPSEPIKTEEEEEEEDVIVDTPLERKSSDETDTDENEILLSDDDFNDLPSDLDNDDILLDEFVDNNGDMEFLRSAAKNLMSSLSEMEAASANMNTLDAPHSLLYGDDFIVTIKSRRFALAFLDYTQFRVEKQRNPEKFRLLASLKKNLIKDNNKKRSEMKQREQTPSPTFESELFISNENKSNSKKKRNKRNRKKKNGNTIEKIEPTPESIENDEDENTIHVLNDQTVDHNQISIQRLPHVYLDNDMKPCIVVAGEEHNEENEQETGEHEDWHNIVAGGKLVLAPKKSKKKKQQHQQTSKLEQNSNLPILPNPTFVAEDNSLIIPSDSRGFLHNPKLYETFRLRLRRSFPSVNIRFSPETYIINIDGNNKTNVQQCLHFLQTISSFKRCISFSYDNFPQTTVTNIIRMQQSTAQVKLDSQADYNRIFRSTYRLIDYQLKQQFNQQQCLFCRRSKKQFVIKYLEFPGGDKQIINEFNENLRVRVSQLFDTRFMYIAISLSADLMITKRWKDFYGNLSKHKDLNKTILIKKINTIIQIYGLHAHVQQIRILITKFLDTNRYETDVIENEQASAIYSLFKKDFQDMENLEIFREAELHFFYRHHRHLLLFQCFQEKFELVKDRLKNLYSQITSLIHPVKSSILSRYYSKSNEIQRIETLTNCIITTEIHGDLIDLKILSRSNQNVKKAEKLIKEFEEQKYSRKKISNNDIHLLTEENMKLLENECNTLNVSFTIDPTNNSIELEGLSGDFDRIERFINELCLSAARRALDEIQHSTQWIFYDSITTKPVAYGDVIKRQLENCFNRKQKGLVQLKDHTNQIRTFDLDKMIEILSASSVMKIERRDFKNPQSVQLPTNWTRMDKPWDRILLGKREEYDKWKVNHEIQRILNLPHMLPEAWIIEIYRVQNPRMFQQYMACKENFAARAVNNERTLFRLAQVNLIDDMCAQGFNRSHTDSAFSAYGHGCHFYCKAIDIDRTATLLAQNFQSTPILLQQPTNVQAPVRFLFVCKVLVGRYTRGEASMKTCPPGYDSLVDNVVSPEIFVTHQDAQVLPEYLIAYQSAIF